MNQRGDDSDDTPNTIDIDEEANEAPLQRSRGFYRAMDPLNSTPPSLHTDDDGSTILTSDPDANDVFPKRLSLFDTTALLPPDDGPMAHNMEGIKTGELALLIQGVYKKYTRWTSVSTGYVLNGIDLKKCYLNKMLVVRYINYDFKYNIFKVI